MINTIIKNPDVIYDPVVLEQKHQLVKLLRHKEASMGMESLYFFDKYILGYNLMELQPHEGLCSFVSNPQYDHQLILEPRGCFKTSCITIGYTIWRIIKNPNIRVLIDSEDLSIAKTFLREIKAHFEFNEELRKLYGDFVGDKWTEAEIIVKKRTKKHLKEPTVSTSGVETTRVSQHYDLILRDDLHSQQNIATPEQIEKVKQHVQLSLSLLEPEGQEITIGTRWHFNDVYSDILEKEEARKKTGLASRYHIRIHKAIYDDGGLHFPTRLNREFLDNQRFEQGSYVFSCQYQNEPVDQASAKFRKSWFQYYGDKRPQDLIITSTLDPAISEKDSACYTTIVTVGTDYEGNIYILDLYRDRVNPKKVIDAIFRVYDQWKPIRFGIEIVAYQKTLKYWAQERAIELGQFPNIIELKTDTRITKAMRIEALIPYSENGLIKFPGFDRATIPSWCEPLVQEMEQFPVGKYLDCIDSLAYQLQIIGRPGGKRTPKPREDTIDAMHKRLRRSHKLKSKRSIPIIGRNHLRDSTPITVEVSK